MSVLYVAQHVDLESTIMCAVAGLLPPPLPLPPLHLPPLLPSAPPSFPEAIPFPICHPPLEPWCFLKH